MEIETWEYLDFFGRNQWRKIKGKEKPTSNLPPPAASNIFPVAAARLRQNPAPPVAKENATSDPSTSEIRSGRANDGLPK